MNVEWTIPLTLTSPYGTLPFNADAGGGRRYLLDPTKCFAGPQTIRTTTDDNPQADGGIVHRAFRSLMTMKLVPEFWVGSTNADATPACGEDLRLMWDTLMLHLGGVISPTQAQLDGAQSRIEWTPSGPVDHRLLDRVQMLGWPAPTNDGIVTSAEFTFQSPYPYAIDKTQTTTDVTGAVTVTNAGSSPFYPVFKVFGPATLFDIFNTTTGLHIAYDGTRPGAITIPGGSYAEIVTFTNTIYLNGDSTNLKAGIVITESDFFPLMPGANDISHDGDGTVDMLWNNAWG